MPTQFFSMIFINFSKFHDISRSSGNPEGPPPDIFKLVQLEPHCTAHRARPPPPTNGWQVSGWNPTYMLSYCCYRLEFLNGL